MSSATQTPSSEPFLARAGSSTESAQRGARLALFVLTAVYLANFLDRYVVSILADRLRADLHVNDADIGFLTGTAFGIFFAVCGLPLARLADAVDRRRLMAACLLLWSLATCASALAGSFGQLATARVLVGIGEAGAAPAAYSLLSDFFPRARRATALATYNAGIYLGIGAALLVGGFVATHWETAYAASTAPLGLRGWQAAFLVAGLPGLLLAGAVLLLREPARGVSEGRAAPPPAAPWREARGELLAVLPPVQLLALLAAGATRAAALNLGAALGLAAAAWALIGWLGHAAQWIALAAGFYALLSWAQRLARRDAPAFAAIFRRPALGFTSLGFAFHSLRGYGLLIWMPTFFQRVLQRETAEVSWRLGALNAACGVLGVIAGGWLADRWRARDPRGRLWFSIAVSILPAAFGVPLLLARDATLAYVLYAPFATVAAMWMGAGAATVTDLAAPRHRATATALYLFLITIIGLGLGPYLIGQISDSLGDLRPAMLLALLAELPAVLCLLRAAQTLIRDEAAARA